MLRLAIALIFLSASQWARPDLVALPGVTPQTVSVGDFLPHRLQFRVSENGVGIPGVAVSYYAGVMSMISYVPACLPIGEGVVDYCVAVTDAEGIATLPPARAWTPGTFSATVTARARNESATFTFTAVVTEPLATAEILGGANQTVIHQQVSQPITLRYTRAGKPLSGLTVQVSARGFDIDYVPELVTDIDGVVTFPVRSWRGYGAGAVVPTTRDVRAGTLLQTEVPMLITTPEGKTVFPLSPLWWGGPGMDGWGLSIAQHGAAIFPVWFLYDSEGEPTWFVPTSTDWGNGFASSLDTSITPTSSAPFYDYDTDRFSAAPATGTAAIDFDSQAGLFSMLLARNSILGYRRLVPFPIASDSTLPDHGVGDIWWGGPAQSGWGLSISEQSGALFLVWFTYGEDGKPIWFAMPEGQWKDASTWTGPIFHTHSCPMRGPIYDATMFRADEVGSFTVRFDGTAKATFDYTAEGRAGSLALERLPF